MFYNTIYLNNAYDMRAIRSRRSVSASSHSIHNSVSIGSWSAGSTVPMRHSPSMASDTERTAAGCSRRKEARSACRIASWLAESSRQSSLAARIADRKSSIACSNRRGSNVRPFWSASGPHGVTPVGKIGITVVPAARAASISSVTQRDASAFAGTRTRRGTRRPRCDHGTTGRRSPRRNSLSSSQTPSPR